MGMITDAELSAMEERAEKATEGPWHTETRGTMFVGGPGGFLCAIAAEPLGDVVCSFEASIAPGEDAAFISAARTDLPRLIAELRALRAQRLVSLCVCGAGPTFAVGSLDCAKCGFLAVVP